MADPQISFVFGVVDEALKHELIAFWGEYGDTYKAEIERFRALSGGEAIPVNPSRRPLHRQPAAIARDEDGAIIGIVFVVLREISPSLGLGSHAYFFRIFNVPRERRWTLANRLFNAFLSGFDRAAERRDHRARVLMADNINPGLRKAFMRRYFIRKGFRLLGASRYGGDVWVRDLHTRFVF